MHFLHELVFAIWYKLHTKTQSSNAFVLIYAKDENVFETLVRYVDNDTVITS